MRRISRGLGGAGYARLNQVNLSMQERTLRFLEHSTIVAPGRSDTGMICQSGDKTMTEPGLQRDGKNEATMTSTLTPPPLIMVNKLRAPVADLSPTKRSAVIECFNNNGLFKRNGYWWGAPEGKHISGVTVADLARDGIFSVITNLRNSSARLTERGQWFARTLVDTANGVHVRE